MFSESALRIELRRGGKVTALEVQYDRALIGSGAHCDVRLAPDEAAVEQLLVETMGEEVYVRTRTMDPPCLMNGAPFFEGRLLPTSLLEIGGLAIRIQRIERQDAKSANKRSSATPPLVQVLGLVVVAAGLYFVLHKAGPADSARARTVLPPPLAAAAKESCPQTDPAAALELADQTTVEAENKRERSPFYPSDALDAITLFERAASCYESARDTTRAREANDAAATLRESVNGDIHVAHVRLERFLAEQKSEEARAEARGLLSMMPSGSPYAQWLSTVIREAELKKEKEKKKHGRKS